MLTVILAVLGASSNAASSVLQRKAHREHPVSGSAVTQALAVLRAPWWLLGFAAVVAGFLLQAAALSHGAISMVEPVLVIELPLTLLLAGVAFRHRLSRRDWLAALAMTGGVGGLLYALAPVAKSAESASGEIWIVGGSINVAVILGLYLGAMRSGSGRRAALLGIATGFGFGLTVALMKSVTNAVVRGGLPAVIGTWQTYGMVLAGLSAMLLLQGALGAGPLVAVQPGVTLVDPLASALWGVLGYHESIRTGGYLIGALVAACVIAAGALALARSPLLGVQGAIPAGSRRISSDAESG